MADRKDLIQVIELGRILKAQRNARGLTLSKVASETGISASTLSRLERQVKNDEIMITPDITTVTTLAKWLQLPAERFLAIEQNNDVTVNDHLKVVEAHLRAGRNLDSESMEMIGNIMQLAYTQAAQLNSSEP